MPDNNIMRRFYRYCILLFWMIGTAAAAPLTPLPVDQAFPLQVWSPNAETVVVQWDIRPGYYLYKDRIQIIAAQDGIVQLGPLNFPPAVEHVNPVLGRFSAYETKTQISVPILSARAQQFPLQIHYQGCSAQGFCYPPETRLIMVNLAAAVNQAPPPVQALLQQHYSWTIWLSFFGLGLLISLTPCVLPMIPVLSGLILGKEHLSHWRAFAISLAYVLGMAVTYAIAGMLFGMLGSSLQAFLQKPWIIVLFSLIFVAMALSLFGLYQLELPEKLRTWVAGFSNRQRRGSIAGAAVMGCLSTLILSPCATPPLVAILSYISQSGNARLGGLALFVVGIGSGVPLLLIGAFGRRLLPKAGPWMRRVENLLGVILLGVGIWMLDRIIPDRISLVLWAGLAIGLAIYLKTFSNALTVEQRVSKGCGILIFVYGILLLVGAVQGATQPWRPLTLTSAACLAADRPHFIFVKTVADVQQRMDQAPGKPVLLDFYAEWCVSCKLFDQSVLTDPAVQAQLAGFLLLRADVTANSTEDQALMHHYNVIAPPTLILFSAQHQELPQARMVGEVSTSQFLDKLKTVP